MVEDFPIRGLVDEKAQRQNRQSVHILRFTTMNVPGSSEKKKGYGTEPAADLRLALSSPSDLSVCYWNAGVSILCSTTENKNERNF